MHTISIPEAMKVVEFVAIKYKRAVMIWGPPGIGKSEGVASMALTHGAALNNDRYIDIRLSQYDSVDLRGIPSVNDGLITWNVPSTLPFKTNPKFNTIKELIFLFLDELNSATPSTLAVCYQLINDRRVGEHELLDNVVIVAAGNRDGDKGVTNRMPLPLANRFTHVEVGLDVDAWTCWAQKKGLPAVGIAYFNWRKDQLMTFDPMSPMKTFCTPRTAAWALEYMTDTTVPRDVKDHVMAGTIGDAVNTELWAFADMFNKITPIAEILKNPTKARLPDEESMMYAMAVSLSGHMTLSTLGPINTYLERMSAEYIVLAWQLGVRRDKELFGAPEFLTYAKKYGKIYV